MQFKNGCILFSYIIAITVVLIVFLGVLFAPQNLTGGSDATDNSSPEESVQIVDLTTPNPLGLLHLIRPIIVYLIGGYYNQINVTNATWSERSNATTSSGESSSLMEETGDDTGLIFGNSEGGSWAVNGTEDKSSDRNESLKKNTSDSGLQTRQNGTNTGVSLSFQNGQNGTKLREKDPKLKNTTAPISQTKLNVPFTVPPSSYISNDWTAVGANKSNISSTESEDKNMVSAPSASESIIPTWNDLMNELIDESNFDKFMDDAMQQMTKTEQDLVPIFDRIMNQVDQVMDQTFDQFIPMDDNKMKKPATKSIKQNAGTQSKSNKTTNTLNDKETDSGKRKKDQIYHTKFTTDD